MDIDISSAKRAKILVDVLLGNLAIAVVFFSVAGTEISSAKIAQDCPVKQFSLERYFVIATVSSFANSMPCLLLFYFFQRSFVEGNAVSR